jgi:Phytanoyl-CoA dioxygenase (PhyH)
MAHATLRQLETTLPTRPVPLTEQYSSAAARAELFAQDGYLYLPQVLARTHVKSWADRFASNGFFQTIFDNLYQRGHVSMPTHCTVAAPAAATTNDATCTSPNESNESVVTYALGRGIKHGFREIVMRSPGRYEISLHDDSSRDEIVRILSESLPWIPSLLSGDEQHRNDEDDDDTEMSSCSSPPRHKHCPTHYPPLDWETVSIVNVSLVVSTPGAPAQAWHADGSHVDLDTHWPCHCLNIFVPLTDVTEINGPTQLRPGSHWYTRRLAPLWLAAKARRTLRPCVAPTLTLGDCLVFDYRLLHRGLANATTTTPLDTEPNIQACSINRTILVVAIAQPWFKDVVNFPQKSLYDDATNAPSDNATNVDKEVFRMGL